jgi:N-acetyl-gamma-glutamyl-phosphate reductase common form
MAETATIPVVVLGGSGYVAGELLRLLAGHLALRVAALASASHAGAEAGALFPHLAGTEIAGLRVQDLDGVAALLTSGKGIGIFAATPHGATAAALDALLTQAERVGAVVHAVDLSADFRFNDPARFAAIYGAPHGAPGRCAEFVCGVPELIEATPARHATQPGCFTTAVVLAAYPLLAKGLARGPIFVSAVTGSSGAGRAPTPTTHHPERRSNLFAYAPLAHRHEAEMRALLAPANGGAEPEVEFVPHSGPFVRGIHATLRLTLDTPRSAEEVAGAMAEFYAASPFVTVSTSPPRLAEVVGSNRCRLGVATRGGTAVVTAVLDNLVKGAAGGAIQWMNRLFGIPEAAGLTAPGLGWV